MTTSPQPDLVRLRQQVGAQLTGWRVVARDGLPGFTHGTGSLPDRSIRGRSCVDPRLIVIAEIGSRNVDNDGTFQTAPVYLASFVVSVEASDEGVSTRELTRAEAIAWRDVLLPEIDYCYALEDPNEPAPLSASVWFFVFFCGSDGEIVAAPRDFDWVSHRIRHRGLRVSLIDRDGRQVETVYENRRFPPFYQPYTESRGRYWHLDLTEPAPSAGISRCFAAVSKAVARRGAIADDIRPLSLTWQHDNVVHLILRCEDTGRCYRLELNVPTDSDLGSGTYVLPASFGGGLPVKLSSPEQYAAGEVARIRDMGLEGIPIWATAASCVASSEPAAVKD